MKQFAGRLGLPCADVTRRVASVARYFSGPQELRLPLSTNMWTVLPGTTTACGEGSWVSTWPGSMHALL